MGHPPPSCAASPGAELMLWDRGGWQVLDTTDAAPTAPGLVEWSSATAPEWTALSPETRALRLEALVSGRTQLVSLAAVPAAPNGCGATYGQILTDYMEIEIGYFEP